MTDRHPLIERIYAGHQPSLGELDAYFMVHANLNLTDCTALTALPDGLAVGGDLYLGGCTALKWLPADMDAKGGIYPESFRSLPRR